MKKDTDDRIEAATKLIVFGRKEEARKVLFTICREQPSAESFWLLSKVLENPIRVEQSLQRALVLDPEHALAADALRKLHHQQSLTDTPKVPLESLSVVSESTAPFSSDLPISGKPKKKKASIRFNYVLLTFIAVVGTVIGGSIYAILKFGFYEIPMPLTGPYYISRAASVEADGFPCEMYTVYGDVIGGSGYSVHVVTDEGFDHTAPVDTQGRYRVDIPRSYVPSFTPMDESNNSFGQYIRSRIELGMSIRLLDSNGAALSGIRMIPFYQQGCSGYYEFSRFEAGRRFGRPVEVTGLDVVNPIYQIMTTEVTSIPNSLMIGEAPHYLDCNFVGLIGRAYAQGVTVDEINVYANSLTDDEEGIHYYTDYTGSFARSMLLPVFSGMWVLSLPKNDQYYVQFMYTPPEYDMHDLGGVVVDIPEETDCQQHVILMSLIPMEILDVPPYRL